MSRTYQKHFLSGAALALLPLAAFAAWWLLRPAPVTLAAVGDVMLARGVAKEAARSGWDHPFANVASELRAADLTVGNLECTLGKEGVPVPKPFSFSAPEESAAALARAGFDVLSLANNHTFDRGRDGLARTRQVLRQYGLAAAGAGDTPEAARRPVFLRRKRLTIAFLAYTQWMPEGYLSVAGRPAIAFADPAAVEADVRGAARQADVVVVSFHWGSEHSPDSSANQQQLAHLAIEAGADVVLGHHPHVRQPVEWYRGRPIFYSLGDFVFDQRSPELSNGWLAVLRLRPDHVSIERLARVELHDRQPSLTWEP